MPQTKTAFLALFPITALSSFLPCRAQAQPPKSAWVGQGQVDSPFKVIQLRRVARVLFGFGKVADDDSLLRLGPARARFLWQKGWRWNEAMTDKLPLGLQGGPSLSFDVLFDRLGPLYSLETRVSSLRYTFANQRTKRTLNEELIDPKDQRQSVEAGVYLNFSLGDSILSPFHPRRFARLR